VLVAGALRGGGGWVQGNNKKAVDNPLNLH